jgi:hypothetical protein
MAVFKDYYINYVCFLFAAIKVKKLLLLSGDTGSNLVIYFFFSHVSSCGCLLSCERWSKTMQLLFEVKF